MGCESGYWATSPSSSSSYLACVKVSEVHFVFHSILGYLLFFLLKQRKEAFKEGVYEGVESHDDKR